VHHSLVTRSKYCRYKCQRYQRCDVSNCYYNIINQYEQKRWSLYITKQKHGHFFEHKFSKEGEIYKKYTGFHHDLIIKLNRSCDSIHVFNLQINSRCSSLIDSHTAKHVYQTTLRLQIIINYSLNGPWKNGSDRFSNFTSPRSANSVPNPVLTNGNKSTRPPKQTCCHTTATLAIKGTFSPMPSTTVVHLKK